MARVTAISPQKERPDRYNLFLDGQFATGISPDTLLRHGLRVGDEVTPEALARIEDEEGMGRALNDALRFLSFRQRSVAEMRRYLVKREVQESTVERVLERLHETGLLDDGDFATRWVENRQTFSPRGPRALKAELRQKGVGQHDIEQAIDGLAGDEDATAEAVARPRAARLQGQDALSFRKKLGDFLLRRGFDYAVARRVTDRLWREQGGEADDSSFE